MTDQDPTLTFAPAGYGGRTGAVSLVGAGPGDPDLLTLRGYRRLRAADVVLHDRLVAAEIVALAPASAQRIYVGKQRDRHPVPQSRINALLIDYARRGLRVVRLKGGDPFIFGRGGEELEELMAAGVPFEVVPGVTAASGCAAYAGIPLTHRDHAQSCVFVTGHRKANGELALDFDQLARPQQTVVFYMGLAGIDRLVAGLLAHGAPSERPAAVVQQGTTAAQRVVAGRLDALPGLVRDAGLRAPTLIVVGEVVRLRERLAWFDPATAENAVAGWSTAQG
ncbi:uroporphyrinogen-III C-methyltransferase [Arhodomonas aquaeolei]